MYSAFYCYLELIIKNSIFSVNGRSADIMDNDRPSVFHETAVSFPDIDNGRGMQLILETASKGCIKTVSPCPFRNKSLLHREGTVITLRTGIRFEFFAMVEAAGIEPYFAVSLTY
jgi:hypothetical protein